MEKADAKVDYSKIIPLLPSFRMYDDAVKYITNIRTLMKQLNVDEKDLPLIIEGTNVIREEDSLLVVFFLDILMM